MHFQTCPVSLISDAPVAGMDLNVSLQLLATIHSEELDVESLLSSGECDMISLKTQDSYADPRQPARQGSPKNSLDLGTKLAKSFTPELALPAPLGEVSMRCRSLFVVLLVVESEMLDRHGNLRTLHVAVTMGACSVF